MSDSTERTVVTVRLHEMNGLSVAIGRVGGDVVAWATDVTDAAAARACMNDARKAIGSAPALFLLPYCGKKFDIPHWEKKKTDVNVRKRRRRSGRAKREDAMRYAVSLDALGMADDQPVDA